MGHRKKKINEQNPAWCFPSVIIVIQVRCWWWVGVNLRRQFIVTFEVRNHWKKNWLEIENQLWHCEQGTVWLHMSSKMFRSSFHFNHDSLLRFTGRSAPICLSDWRVEEVSSPWLKSRDFSPRKQGCSKTGGWFSEWEKSAALPFSCRSKTPEVRETEPQRLPVCWDPTSTGSHYRSEAFFPQPEICNKGKTYKYLVNGLK